MAGALRRSCETPKGRETALAFKNLSRYTRPYSGVGAGALAKIVSPRLTGTGPPSSVQDAGGSVLLIVTHLFPDLDLGGLKPEHLPGKPVLTRPRIISTFGFVFRETTPAAPVYPRCCVISGGTNRVESLKGLHE